MNKKEMEKKVEKVKDVAEKQLDKLKVLSEKEIAKIRLHMDNSAKKVEKFIKENPEKATVISAGIGAALGAAIAIFSSKDDKKKKK